MSNWFSLFKKLQGSFHEAKERRGRRRQTGDDLGRLVSLQQCLMFSETPKAAKELDLGNLEILDVISGLRAPKSAST